MAVPWVWEEAGLENLYVMDGRNGDPLDGRNGDPLDGHFCNWLHVLVEWSLPCRLEEHWIKMQQGEVGTWGGVIPFAGEARRRAVVWRKLLLMGLEERFLQRSGCLVLWAVCSRILSSLSAIVYKCGSFSSFGCYQMGEVGWDYKLEVVTALSNVSKANVLVRNIVRDFLDVVSSSFCYVNIAKATRQDVRDAHNLARSRLCNFINV